MVNYLFPNSYQLYMMIQIVLVALSILILNFYNSKLLLYPAVDNSFSPNSATQNANTGESDQFPAIQNYTTLSNVAKYLPIEIANKNTKNDAFIGRILQNNGTADISNANLNNVSVFCCRSTTQDDFKITKTNQYNTLAPW